MFDRELELALEMSKHESSQETNGEMNSAPKKRAKEVNAVVHSAPLQPAGTTTLDSSLFLKYILCEKYTK